MKIPSFSQNPRDPDFVQNPYSFYEKARAAGPLFFWTEYDMLCCASYAGVDALLRNRRFGREAPPSVRREAPAHLKPFYDIEANSMLELEPPRHTKLRSQVLRAFTARQVAGLAPGISTLCDALIADFPTEPFDLLSAYAERIPVIVIARMMGVPDDKADDLLAWSHAMVAMYQARRDRAVEDAAVSATLAFRAYVESVISEKRAAPTDDLISGLVTAGDGALSEDEIVATCILILNAGHEATVHAIGNGVAAVLPRFDQPAALYADDDATHQMTCELLRFDPPLHMFTRYAMEDVEFGGHHFKEGEQIALLLGAANRDPAMYPDPHKFDPTRPVTAHTAFGAGLHFCVGAPLARLEMNIAMPRLFQACPDLKLAESPSFADRYHFHGLSRLMVST